MANQSKFPTSLIVGAAVVLAATAYLVLPTLGGGPDVDMSEAAVQERIKPIGTVATTAQPANTTPAKPEPGKVAEPAALAASAAPGATAASTARSGEDIFNSFCTACHSTGAAGAPKVGDKEAWAPFIATGMDTMLEIAIKGKNAMPPRGTCADCSDDELKSAIEYMVSKSQ